MAELYLPKTYQGYPHLDRIAVRQKDCRLKPARALRFWYLAQPLPRVLHHDTLFYCWGQMCRRRPHDRDYFVEVFRDGAGVYWERLGPNGGVRIRSPEELHALVEAPVVRQYRPFAALDAEREEWDRHLVASGLLYHHSRARRAGRFRLTRTQLGELTGFHRRTIQKHLQDMGFAAFAIPRTLPIHPTCIPPQALVGKVKRLPGWIVLSWDERRARLQLGLPEPELERHAPSLPDAGAEILAHSLPSLRAAQMALHPGDPGADEEGEWVGDHLLDTLPG